MNDHFVMPNTIISTLKRNSRENERPLVEDIRLLGRLLGDVIRKQEGGEGSWNRKVQCAFLQHSLGG